MKVIMSMIEAELSFFDVEVEASAGESPMLGQAGLGIAPEGLDAVDRLGPRANSSLL